MNRDATQRRTSPRLGRALCCLALLTATSAISAGRVTGKIVDLAGKAVDGLEVRFVPGAADAQPIPPAMAKKGKFAVADFPRGAYRVELSGNQWVVRRMDFELRDAEGSMLGEQTTEIVPGTLPPAFEVGVSQRAQLTLHVGPSASGGQARAGVTVAHATATSKDLERLNGLLEDGDMAGLLAGADKILAKEPDLGGAVYLRGVALWKLGRIEEATVALERASTIDPDQVGVRGVLGQVRMAEGEAKLAAGDEAAGKAAFGRAAEDFAAELVKAPGEVVWLHNRMVALDRGGQVEPTLEALDALLEADPDNRQARLRRGELLADAGRLDEALASFQAIRDPGREVAIAMANVGITLYNDGQTERVVPLLRRAIEIDPSVGYTHLVLGRALLAQSDFAGAANEVREFLRLAPDDPEAESARKLLDALAAKQ